MFVRPLFKLMADTQASDLFFTAGAPVQIKIKGEVMPVDSQRARRRTHEEDRLRGDDAKSRSRSSRREHRDQLLARRAPASAASASTSSGSAARAAMVIRHIKHDVPTIEQLRLPPVLKDLVMEKRGLILVVGSTGSGKSSTLAAMINYRNHDAVGPHPHDRGPDRVHVQAREEHRQPARGRHRHAHPTTTRW